MILTRSTVARAFVAASVACGLVACGSSEPASAPEPTGGSTAAPEPTSSTTDAPEPSTVEFPASGESNGRRVTIESSGTTTLEFTEPDPGNDVIFIEVTVENLSAEPWNSNSFQFFLRDATGEEYSPELLGSAAGPNLPNVDSLEQGQSSTGFVAFQVPPNTALWLSYAVDLSQGITIEIPVR